MPQIMNHIGKGLLAAVVIIGIVFILFQGVSLNGKKGVLKILGSYAEISREDLEHYLDGAAAESAATRKKPVICYDGRIIIRKGTTLKVEEFIYGKDAEETVLTVFIKGIEDQEGRTSGKSGTAYLDYYDKAAGTLSFPDKGIYRVSVVTRDKEQLETKKVIEIAVDR